MNHEITHLIFDCDGVLIDSEILATRISLRMLAEYGYENDEMSFSGKYSGYLTEEILKMLIRDHGLDLPADFEDQLFMEMEKAFNTELQAVSGMPELIRKLSLPKNVVSNGHSNHVRRALHLTKLTDFFGEEIFSIEQVANGKPAPDIYQLALQTLKLSPQQVLVVEDSEAGVQAAHAAGISVIGFTGASHLSNLHMEKLIDSGADYVVSSARELASLLSKLLPSNTYGFI